MPPARCRRVFTLSHIHSSIFLSELSTKNVSELELDEKVKFYDKANKQVAILCNHQKTVPKSFQSTVEKMERKIAELDDSIKYH